MTEVGFDCTLFDIVATGTGRPHRYNGGSDRGAVVAAVADAPE
jgi:hypothetical protein